MFSTINTFNHPHVSHFHRGPSAARRPSTELGVTERDILCFLEINGDCPVSVEETSTQTGISKSAVHATLRKLEARGSIEITSGYPNSYTVIADE